MQIRGVNNVIVGTGFVVSPTGKIVTCCHVVRDAGGQVAEGVEINVYFPKAIKSEQKAHTATVTACFLDHDDDVVVLQLDTATLPDGIEPAILGMAEGSAGNKFRSFGYRRLQNYQGLPAHGEIVDFAESPETRILHSDPVMLNSQHIDSGMSGSAVLDIERNLVVGVIAETWDSGESEKDRDTSFAVDCRVLAFDPMCLPLADAPSTPQPTINSNPTGEQPVSQPGIISNLNNAPAPLEEWVGRADFLKTLNQDWADPNCSIVGLIGFGGEGKSSLTRRWLEDLLHDSSLPQPTGVFWWGFYEKNNVLEFLEAALEFLVPGIDPYKVTWAEKVNFIHGMLKSGRYLLILDGLEVLQQEEGDDYGELTNLELRDFLREFAAGKHESFCLINSRAPLVDLIDFTTYTHRDVERLSQEEGRTLLRKVGVKGADNELNKIVADWDGYALVLSLLGAYLVDVHDGNVKYIREIKPPTASEPRYERVQRVLRRYDEHLTQAEKEFLTIFSAFRLAVPPSLFTSVFQGVLPGQLPGYRPPTISALDVLFLKLQSFYRWLIDRFFPNQRREAVRLKRQLNAPLADLRGRTFNGMILRLLNYRILRFYPEANYYTMHPLISAHYSQRLQKNLGVQRKEIHQRIADYYLKVAGPIPEKPSIESLVFPIEAVHHLCCAGSYDRGFDVFWERVLQGTSLVLTHELDAWDVSLALMVEFFPNGDTSQEPQVSTLAEKYWILNNVGLSLMSVGRLAEALPFYERVISMYPSTKDWLNMSILHHNLASLYAFLGKLEASADAARKAFNLACLARSETSQLGSLRRQGWTAHLQGDNEMASVFFQQAEALQREIDPSSKLYLSFLLGIHQADYLLRVGSKDYARQVAEANLEIYQRKNWPATVSNYYRVLGDLDADARQNEDAREHYSEALKIARSISERSILIEALLARGRWAARRGDVAAARGDLEEALNYACTGGYRIYEADIRVALGWMHLANHNYSAATVEAEKARLMSDEMGYYWGRVDADEVLQALKQNF
ncbi:tetratricopeptide repeat protein [Nostoc parmelioides FACHB-3921]|uniref:Tetratricopeptide repeat protein n=1 Tax=Nostoc parmelioides FACHB-3921 TaxID=2692909 RepID=A0ABR8BEC1_9NOSO|nr:tetratricopeptide repeat protein [Nostoc parmelioides FACHB-3921]